MVVEVEVEVEMEVVHRERKGRERREGKRDRRIAGRRISYPERVEGCW